MNRSVARKFQHRKSSGRCTGYFTRVLLGIVVGVSTAPAFSHHSFPAEFDRSKQGELTGTIVEVWFKNPHARYRMQVPNEDGSLSEWDIQTTSVTSLRQSGWGPDTLKIGETVRVWGDLGHGNTKKLYMRGMQKSDGTEYLPMGAVRIPSERDQVTASASNKYSYAQVNPDHPIDISGTWSNFYKFQLTVDDLEPKPTPFTDEGRRIFEATEHWHDDVLRCMPLGLPRTFGSPYAMEIVDAGTHYVVIHEQNNTPRWIWMNGREIPPDLAPSYMGFSIGRWEDDVLVIETGNLVAGTLDGSLLPMSGDGTRIVEHWVFSDDRLTMDRTMTIHDPYYTKPLIRRRGSARRDDLEVFEPAPCDPDGYFRDLKEAGRLDQHLSEP